MKLLQELHTILSEAPSNYVVTDIAHEKDFIMALVTGHDDGKVKNTFSDVNVVFHKDGDIELVTGDAHSESITFNAKVKKKIIAAAREAIESNATSKAYLEKLLGKKVTEEANTMYQIRLRLKGDDKIVADNVSRRDLATKLKELAAKHKVDVSEFEMFKHGSKSYEEANK